MPELPDVEGFRRVLAEHGQGRRVREVEVFDRGVLRDTSPAALARALTGRRFGEPERLGKWLVARTDGPTVLLHFGMTGRLLWCGRDAAAHRHDRVVFRLDDGELRYRDMRKLKGLRLAEDEDAVRAVLDDEGPDALAVDRADFGALLSRSRARLKAVLMDQGRIAGLGNLLVDEILWRARLRPDAPANGLDGTEQKRLHSQMRRVLLDSLPTGQVPPRTSWLTGVRDDTDPPCPRCGTALARRRVAGRNTVWCPHCQGRPR